MAVVSKKTIPNQDLFENFPGKPLTYYLGVYLIVSIALFHEAIFGFGKLVYGTDLMAGNLFFRQYLVDFFRSHGSWPVWDPFIHAGMPFIESIHGDIFYIPSFLIYLLLGVNYGWGFLFALHAFAAGAFMLLFLKEIGIRGKVAFLGGLIYMVAPFFISLVFAGHNGKFFVIALTPLLFFIYLKAANSGKLIYYLFLSIVMFLVMTTPHMQLAYFLFWALALFVVFDLVGRWRKENKFPLRPLAFFGLSAVLGILLSLVQFLAPYQYLKQYSMRTIRSESGKGYEYSTSWSMHWEEAAANFFPEFCGDDISGQKQTYWGRNPFKLNSEHVSIVALFLSIFGILLWKKPDKWFFLIAAIIAGLFTLGANTPFFKLFYMIPGISSFRAPSLATFVFGFSLVTLGSMGLDAFLGLQKGDKELKKAWTVFAYACIAYSAIALFMIIFQMGFFEIWFSLTGYSPEPRKLDTLRQALDNITIGAVISLAFVWVLFGLLRYNLEKKIRSDMLVLVLAAMTAIYMWSFDSRYIMTINPKQHLGRTPIVDFFKARQQLEGPFRVMVLPQTLPDYYLAYHHIEELSFSQMHGNHLASFEILAGNRGSTYGLVFQPVQDLFNIRYFVSRQQLPQQRFKEEARFGEIKIYRNLTALPRAFPVYDWEIQPDENAAIGILTDTSFAYGTRLLLTEPPPGLNKPAADTSLGAPVAARVYDNENSSFKIDVDMLEDGLLFLSENYYPPWKVYENGKILTTLKADVNFRAIPLKKGKHTVICRFENKTYEASFDICLITLVGIIVLSVFNIIRNRIIAKRAAS